MNNQGIIVGLDVIINGLQAIRAEFLEGEVEKITKVIEESAPAPAPKTRKGKATPKVVEVEEVVEEAVEVDDAKAELDALSYNDLKKKCKELGVPAKGNREEITQAVLDAIANGEVAPEEIEEEEVEEEVVEVEAPKTKKGKKAKTAPVVAPPEEVEEDEEELANKEEEYGLVDWTQEDLATLLTEHSLSKKGKRQTLLDRVIEGIEDGTIPLAEEDEEDAEEEEVEEDDEEAFDLEEALEGADDEVIKALAKELGLRVTAKTKVATLKKNIIGFDGDDELLVNALIEVGLMDAEEDEEEEEADEEEDEGTQVEDVKHPDVEASVESDTRKLYKSSKLKDATIKKFLNNYYEGDPDCKDCKGCNKEEALECYIAIQKRMVDDEGNVTKFEEYYDRNEVGFCCGKELGELENGNLYCEICGTEFQL